MPLTLPAVPGALYQTHPPGVPVRLELLANEAGPREFHFYVAGADVADLAPLLAPALGGTQAVLFKEAGEPGVLVAGEELLRRDAGDKCEWLAVRPPAPPGLAEEAHEDLAAFRLRTPGATAMYSATGDRRFRMVFTDQAPYRACARAALRGYMMRCAGRVVSPPNDRVCDQFLSQARRGLTSVPEHDFLSKGTAFEFTAWTGRTPWSAGWIGDSDPGEDRILVYYDRVAGIWAVAT